LARLLPFPVAVEAEAVAAATDDSLPEVFRSFVVFRHDSIRRRASSLDSVSCLGNISCLKKKICPKPTFLVDINDVKWSSGG
jgi:hypothetical protein